MHEYIGKNIILTSKDWFIAPDGNQYKAIWGQLKAVKEVAKELGININRAHANWFYEIGDFIVMGCQVNYLCLCEQPPENKGQNQWAWNVEKRMLDEYLSPSYIYISKQ